MEKRIQKEKNEARHRRELDAQDTHSARQYRRSVIGEGISSCFEAIFGEPGELIKTMLILLIPSFIVSCFLGMHVQFLVEWVDNYLKWGILVLTLGISIIRPAPSPKCWVRVGAANRNLP